MPSRTYIGSSDRVRQGGFLVTFRADGDEGTPWVLSPKPSQQHMNHSPDGFSWGYHGSGCAQLALALLLEETTEEEALELYQRFKREVIAQWPTNNNWVCRSDRIQLWLAGQRMKAGQSS